VALGLGPEYCGPSGTPTVIFREIAFADGLTKTNLAAIVIRHGAPTV